MRRFRPDAIIGVALLVLSAELFRETYSFRVPPFATMSTATWPRFVLILLALLSIALLVQSLLQSPGRTPQTAAQRTQEPGGKAGKVTSHRNALICFGLFAAFLVSLHWLGMLIAGVAFVFLMQELMGPRSLKSSALHFAIAVISVGGMWAVFTFALRVILPEGMLLRL